MIPSQFHFQYIWTTFLEAQSARGSHCKDFELAQMLLHDLIIVGDVTNTRRNTEKFRRHSRLNFDSKRKACLVAKEKITSKILPH